MQSIFKQLAISNKQLSAAKLVPSFYFLISTTGARRAA